MRKQEERENQRNHEGHRSHNQNPRSSTQRKRGNRGLPPRHAKTGPWLPPEAKAKMPAQGPSMHGTQAFSICSAIRACLGDDEGSVCCVITNSSSAEDSLANYR